MKKGITFSLCVLGIGIVFIMVGLGLAHGFQHYGLMFREWTKVIFVVIVTLLGFALICGIIYTLAKVFSRPQEQLKIRVIQKVLSASGIVVVLYVIIRFGIIVLLLLAFTYKPEHVIEKHGQKMVVYVDSFLDVNVTYHEYKNFLICGYAVIGEEGYGSGGYDPFTRDPVPEPVTSQFYDMKQD